MATWGGDRWRLSHFSLFHNNPFKLPRHGEILRESLSNHASDLSWLVARAGRFIDYSVHRGLIGDQLEKYLVFPDTIVRPSITRSKNILAGPQYSPLKDRIDLIYILANDDDFYWRRSLSRANKEKFRKRLFKYFITEDEQYHDFVYEMVEKVDFNRMIAGAQDIAEAVRHMADSSDELIFPEVRREVKTRKGLIVIGGRGDDIYQYYTPPLLIIDGGGNDEYHLSGYPDDYPLSVIVDLSGNDRYISADSTTPGIAGAVLSMSVLVDKEGDDYYESRSLAQGAALFGVGLLYDCSGHDVYTAEDMSQGAAGFWNWYPGRQFGQ